MKNMFKKNPDQVKDVFWICGSCRALNFVEHHSCCHRCQIRREDSEVDVQGMKIVTSDRNLEESGILDPQPDLNMNGTIKESSVEYCEIKDTTTPLMELHGKLALKKYQLKLENQQQESDTTRKGIQLFKEEGDVEVYNCSSVNLAGMYIVQVGPLFSPTVPDKGRFFSFFLLAGFARILTLSMALNWFTLH